METCSRGVCLIHGIFTFHERRGVTSRPVKDSEEKPIELEYLGSGFHVSDHGHVVTNRHVAEPWWNNERVAPLLAAGLEPTFIHLTATFPDHEPLSIAPQTIRVSTEGVDVAVFVVSVSGVPVRPLSDYDPYELRGEPLMLLGYQAGLAALAEHEMSSLHDHSHTPAEATPAHLVNSDTSAASADQGHHHMESPRRIRATAELVLSRQGVSESPLIDEILVDRVRTLSRDPIRESILILGHGPGDDSENARWLTTMKQRAARICDVGRFRAVKCETLREDWPEKRVAAEKRIRRFVEEGNRDGGRVIVVPFRVAGFGPYKEVLDGLNYVADGRGFCPHPNMTRWLQETLRETLATQ